MFFVAAGAALSDVIVTLTNQETLEVQRRRPFICQHSRGTMCWGITLLFGQLATNSRLLIFALDARNVTSSTIVLGHVLSINMGMQFVGLCFLARRSVLFLPLIMASLSWKLRCNRDRRVADAVDSLFLLTPVNAAFFHIVQIGIPNIFGAQTFGESLAAVGVLEQIASTVDNVGM